MKNTCISRGGALVAGAVKWLRGLAFAIFACVWVPTGFAQTADLEVTIQPGLQSPAFGADTFIDFTIENNGPNTATGITVDVPLPSGLTFQSDLSGGDYNPTTGIWTVPGGLNDNDTVSLRLIARVQSFGDFDLQAEILTSSLPDPDSTPGNGSTTEDDFFDVEIFPQSPPPTLFCLGRPITPLVFANPIADSQTPNADPNAPALNDVFRFVGVAPGIDALVEVTGASANAELVTIDNAGAGVPANLQPTLAAPAGEAYVDIAISMVQTGQSVPGIIDFAGSAIDVDGNGNGLREFVEVSNNVVEFAVNDPTALDITFPDPDDDEVPESLAADRIRFESRTDGNAPSISPDVPENIVTAFFTDVATFEYRVGKFGGVTGGRLNSLAFNCPEITPTTSTTNTLDDEDFTDTPDSYGNAIHVIDPAFQLGATNTPETESGDSADASSDAGDDGVTGLPAVFEGGVPVTFNVNVLGAGGLLQGFFDWNADGDFEDAGEHAIVDQTFASGSGVFPVTVTPSSTVTGPSFARFRWSSASVGVFDPAIDGEVEDYQIDLQAPPPGDLSLSITAWPNNPFAGNPTTLSIIVRNEGTETVGNIIALLDLPFGIGFISSNGGADFDIGTGIWEVPGDLAPGEIATLEVVASTAGQGSFEVRSEITSADRPDIDSTPANFDTVDEDDSDAVNLFVGAAPVGTPVCPVGTILVSQLGNAVAVQDTAGLPGEDPAADALGPIPVIPDGQDPNTVAAQINNPGDRLVLDLGVVVPENAVILVALAREGGDNDVIGEVDFAPPSATDPTQPGTFTRALNYGDVPLGPINFVSNITETQDLIQRINVNVPAGGVRFIEFRTTNDDDFFVDGVEFSQICIEGGELQGSKTIAVFDPLGEGLFALPGNDVTYTITVSNVGDGQTDEDSIFLIDELPPEVVFFNGDADGPGPGLDPVNFAELTATGLDPFVFNDSVRFAGAGPAPIDFNACALVPQPGYDPNIRYICFNPQGVMNAGDPDPSFTLSFRARIQ